MGPSLSLRLLREIGVEDHPANSTRRSRHHKQLPRKELRRTERGAQKTPHLPRPKGRPTQDGKPQHRNDDRTDRPAPNPPAQPPPPKSILKRKREPEPEPEPEEPSLSTDSDSDEHDDAEEEVEGDLPPVVSKAVRKKLAEDDAEIADLEKKLGLKRRKNLPQSFKEDGLGDLLEDIDSLFDDEAHEKKKRKVEADEWLAEKRRKAAASNLGKGQNGDEDSDEGSEAEDMLELGLGEEEDDDDLGEEASEDLSDDEMEDASLDGEDVDKDEEDSGFEGFEGFDSEGDESPPPKEQRKRENPYVAPTTGATPAKYVPPSRRVEAGSNLELTSRIRRQTQGLVNRLTEANMISILGEIEKVYREHPRQYVTSILSNLLLVQVCDPSSLPDTLLILTAGFATAAYRVIGMDFGAHLIQATVEKFKEHYERGVSRSREQTEVTKEASNIITFLAELYNFQLIGCNLMFDYVRLLLEELSELNAELLLRVIRMCGTSLRQDDPMALKDIVALVRPAMARTGEQNISVRTKFMIETINDLKNNKMKAGASSSAIVTEHTVRMRKLLGSMSSRKLKTTEPLRMGLKDIEESDKRGKWWLVGSSWAGAAKADATKPQNGAPKDGEQSDESDDDDDDVGFDLTGLDGAPDVTVLAREQMMNTDVRRSIFVAIMSATDCEDARNRIMKLRLNKDRQREIPNVLLRCAGSEQQYNPYYSLVARRLCGDRKIRWAFQDALWKLFRRLGESLFGDAADEDAGGDDEDEATELRRIVNVAKLYGSLVAEGVLGLQILKCLNLVYLRPKTRALVEVLLITAILETAAKNPDAPAAGRKKKREEEEDVDDKMSGADEAVHKMFGVTSDGAGLARGLQYFLRKVVRKSDLAGGKANAKILRRGCRVAEKTLVNALIEESTES